MVAVCFECYVDIWYGVPFIGQLMEVTAIHGNTKRDKNGRPN